MHKGQTIAINEDKTAQNAAVISLGTLLRNTLTGKGHAAHHGSSENKAEAAPFDPRTASKDYPSRTPQFGTLNHADLTASSRLLGPEPKQVSKANFPLANPSFMLEFLFFGAGFTHPVVGETGFV